MNGPRSRSTLVAWFTCELDRMDHAISDEDMAAGFSAGAGRYEAVCGTTVCASSLTCPPGRRCASCEAIVQRISRESLPPKTGVLIRWRGRGRKLDDRFLAVAASRLFGQLK